MANFKATHNYQKSISVYSCFEWTSLCLLLWVTMLVSPITGSPLVTEVTGTRGTLVKNSGELDLQTSDSFNLGYGYGGPSLFGNGYGSQISSCGGGGNRPFYYPSSYTFGNGYGHGLKGGYFG